jgi:hypothetical protein
VSNYHFCMHKDSASVEGLGAIILANDAEALAFATQVIRDIKTGAHGRYDGWTMDITERSRDAGAFFSIASRSRNRPPQLAASILSPSVPAIAIRERPATCRHSI